jgi:hypothetical protein
VSAEVEKGGEVGGWRGRLVRRCQPCEGVGRRVEAVEVCREDRVPFLPCVAVVDEGDVVNLIPAMVLAWDCGHHRLGLGQNIPRLWVVCMRPACAVNNGLTKLKSDNVRGGEVQSDILARQLWRWRHHSSHIPCHLGVGYSKCLPAFHSGTGPCYAPWRPALTTIGIGIDVRASPLTSLQRGYRNAWRNSHPPIGLEAREPARYSGLRRRNKSRSKRRPGQPESCQRQ